jgi:hypothetical protein
MVAAEDLILSKLLWAKAGGSELQRRDVRGMVALQAAPSCSCTKRCCDRILVSSLPLLDRSDRYTSRSC